MKAKPENLAQLGYVYEITKWSKRLVKHKIKEYQRVGKSLCLDIQNRGVIIIKDKLRYGFSPEGGKVFLSMEDLIQEHDGKSKELKENERAIEYHEEILERLKRENAELTKCKIFSEEMMDTLKEQKDSLVEFYKKKAMHVSKIVNPSKSIEEYISNAYNPDTVTHPREIIKELMIEQNMRVPEFAEALNTTPKAIGLLLNGGQLNPDIVYNIEKVFKIPAYSMMAMQKEHYKLRNLSELIEGDKKVPLSPEIAEFLHRQKFDIDSECFYKTIIIKMIYFNISIDEKEIFLNIGTSDEMGTGFSKYGHFNWSYKDSSFEECWNSMYNTIVNNIK